MSDCIPQLPTAEYVRSVLSYDPLSGIFRFIKGRKGAAKGRIAGHRRCDGYLIIGLDGREYYGQRLAWLIMTGEWPKFEVDHRDVDPSNNRWSNLREADHPHNHANKKIPKNNKSGYKGVCRCKMTGRWVAQTKLRGKRIFLGRFDSPELAHEAYSRELLKNFGEFARVS